MSKNLLNIILVIDIFILFIVMSVVYSSATQIDKNYIIPFTLGNTLYVGGDGPGNFTRIQDAIDHAYDGDTIFVYNGTYKEHITIDKQIYLFGEDRNNTIIHGQNEPNKDIVYIIANQVYIRGFCIKYSGELSTGLTCVDCSYNIISDCNLLYHQQRTIYLLRSSYSIIENCVIKDSNTGILVSEEQSDHNTISDCYISTERVALDLSSSHNKVLNCILKEGMNIHWGSNNTILNCHISNDDGSLCIQMGYTSNNKLRNNTLKNGGIIFNVNFPYEYYHDIDTSNTIDGRPIYYILEDKNREFNETMDIGYIGLISCKNISVKNLFLQGAVLGNTSFTTIENCSFYENLLGIDIGLSTNNIVTNCDFSTYNSIRIRKSSNNFVSDCRMLKGGESVVSVDINYYSSKNNISYCSILNFDIGIIIGGESSDNNIIGCNISYNDYWGVWLSSSENKITKNRMRYNADSGIWILSTTSNIISNNFIESNSKGIYCVDSSSNKILYNNLENNDYGIFFEESHNNRINNNNFLKNKLREAFFINEGFSNFRNMWNGNYWGRLRIFPYPIFGKILFIPWVQLDWYPAKVLYDI